MQIETSGHGDIDDLHGCTPTLDSEGPTAFGGL